MRLGISLFILGAILAFAVRAESSWLDVQTVGLVLMVGGIAFAAYARTRVRRREVTSRELTTGEVTGRGAHDTEGRVHRTVVTEEDGGYR